MSCQGCCCGGAKPVADLKDPNLVAVFKQAVEAHNSSASDSLELVEIVSATQQVVSGFMFRGVAKCSKAGAVGEYEIEVWQKAGGKEIELKKCVAK